MPPDELNFANELTLACLAKALVCLGSSVRTNCDELPENRQFVALPPLCYGVGSDLVPRRTIDIRGAVREAGRSPRQDRPPKT
jgi:hypothetical protein